ncbi:MAG: hypothetical protein IAF38_05375 [Bacteroidia bacterium]|nr:hypothetical protein [Bacteroidia bacterium]
MRKIIPIVIFIFFFAGKYFSQDYSFTTQKDSLNKKNKFSMADFGGNVFFGTGLAGNRLDATGVLGLNSSVRYKFHTLTYFNFLGRSSLRIDNSQAYFHPYGIRCWGIMYSAGYYGSRFYCSAGMGYGEFLILTEKKIQNGYSYPFTIAKDHYVGSGLFGGAQIGFHGRYVGFKLQYIYGSSKATYCYGVLAGIEFGLFNFKR